MELSDPYPADSEQFMLIEHMSGQVEKIETAMQDMMSNTVNIERLQKDVEKILSDIEKLNQHATTLQIMEKDLVENTEFRIKWPRGLLGSLPR